MALTEREWTERVKRLLKAELTRRGITYGELAKRLHAIGVDNPSATSQIKFRVAGSVRRISFKSWKRSG